MERKTSTKKRSAKSSTKRSTAKPKGLSPWWNKLTPFSKLAQLAIFGLAAAYVTGFIIIAVYYYEMGLPPSLSTGGKYLSASFLPLITLTLMWFSMRLLEKHYKLNRRPAFPFFFNRITVIIILSLTLIIFVYFVRLSFAIEEVFKGPGNLFFKKLLIVSIIFIALGMLTTVLSKIGRKCALRWLVLGSWFIAHLALLGIPIPIIIILTFTYKNIAVPILISLWFIFTTSISWLFVIRVFKIKYKFFYKLFWAPLLAISSILAWLFLYGILVYPTVPHLFGGGEPYYVTLYIQKHPLYPSLPANPDSLLNIEAELIDKTGSEYILRIEDSLGKQHIVEISKDKIESMIYLTPKEIKARQATADSLEKIKKLEGEPMGPFPPDSS